MFSTPCLAVACLVHAGSVVHVCTLLYFKLKKVGGFQSFRLQAGGRTALWLLVKSNRIIEANNATYYYLHI